MLDIRGRFLGGVKAAFGSVARATIIGGLLGAFIAEVGGLTLSAGWPASGFVHIMAVLLGLAFAYGAGLTTALIYGARGMVGLAERVEQTIEHPFAGTPFGSPPTGGAGRVVESEPSSPSGASR
ncbi:MAG TPA: hypothetical protein VF807_01385 [Ktedonobacterales bacterium]